MLLCRDTGKEALSSLLLLEDDAGGDDVASELRERRRRRLLLSLLLRREGGDDICSSAYTGSEIASRRSRRSFMVSRLWFVSDGNGLIMIGLFLTGALWAGI